MHPNPKSPVGTAEKFQPLRITLRQMVEALPYARSVNKSNRVAFNQKLQEISLFIQSTLIDPGNEIAGMIWAREIGNFLYDVARKNNHRATMNWLLQAFYEKNNVRHFLVNFVIAIENDSSYEITVSNFGRVTPNDLSKEQLIPSSQFPLIFQGYGTVWGKSIEKRKLERDEIVREIIQLNVPASAILKISVHLSGKVPPYLIELSYSALSSEELRAKHLLKSKDPLDIFNLLKYHKLTESSRRLMSSYLKSDEILSWPDATQAQDPILNGIVITTWAGRYTRRDIYRYILNLGKDNYTVQDIQKAFNEQVQEIGRKYVLGWGEYAKMHAAELGAGPWGWWTMMSKAPIKKDEVVPVALQLLKKAYRNLMIDKGVVIKE